MGRGRYIAQKLGFAVLTIAVVLILNFVLFRILPGDPVRLLARDSRLPREAQERIRRNFGLNKPLWLNFDGSTVEVIAAPARLRDNPVLSGAAVKRVGLDDQLEYLGRSDDGDWIEVGQIDANSTTGVTGWVPADKVRVHTRPFDSQFFAYLWNLVRGDMGFSFVWRRSVSDILIERIGKTVLLLITGEVVAIVLGTGLGLAAAWRRGTSLDTSALIVALVTWSMPVFWLGIILLMLAGGRLPLGGIRTVGVDYASVFDQWRDLGKHLLLPTITIAVALLGEYVLIMRSSVLEVLAEDYILVAKAKGLSTFQILKDHALKNAALPMITMIALTLGYTVAGAVQVETVFSWPGVGRLMYEAVNKRDFPVLQGAFLVLAISVILANLAADILYSILDPRVRPE